MRKLFAIAAAERFAQALFAFVLIPSVAYELDHPKQSSRRLRSLARNGKRHSLVRGAMVRPESLAVEGQRAGCERNSRQILHCRTPRARVEPGNPPLFGLVRHTFVFAAAQHIDESLDK